MKGHQPSNGHTLLDDSGRSYKPSAVRNHTLRSALSKYAQAMPVTAAACCPAHGTAATRRSSAASNTRLQELCAKLLLLSNK
jgi:hypothetical protein